MGNNLVAIWRKVSRDLHLSIEIPFVLSLESGAQVKAELLLRNFGAKNGMLIITDYSQVKLLLGEIAAAGYGFSTLKEPSDVNYDRAEFINMLNDWGWSGPKEQRPQWCES